MTDPIEDGRQEITEFMLFIGLHIKEINEGRKEAAAQLWVSHIIVQTFSPSANPLYTLCWKKKLVLKMETWV